MPEVILTLIEENSRTKFTVNRLAIDHLGDLSPKIIIPGTILVRSHDAYAKLDELKQKMTHTDAGLVAFPHPDNPNETMTLVISGMEVREITQTDTIPNTIIRTLGLICDIPLAEFERLYAHNQLAFRQPPEE